MLPERYRRLLKRRLRRRPLLPFLLAATLAIDAVILASGQRLGPLAGGFLASQLGLLAIWATGSPQRTLTRLLAAMVGLLGLIAVVERVDVGSEGVAGPVLASMFLVQCATGAGVHAAARALNKRPRLRARLRFSVGTLLLAMLLVAGVATFSRFGDWSQLLKVNVALFILAEAIPLAVMLALAYAAPAGWRRHALLVWLPLACVAFGYTLYSRGLTDHAGVYYGVQAMVFGVWLTAIEVRCRPESSHEIETIDDVETSEPPPETPSTESTGETEPAPMTIPMRFDSSV